MFSGNRVTLYNYHKIVRQYTKLAFHLGFIESDPYDNPMCKFGKGRSAERQPLTEDELLLLRSMKLDSKEERVRDLFIFCAYTGLAYADSPSCILQCYTINSLTFSFFILLNYPHEFFIMPSKRCASGDVHHVLNLFFIETDFHKVAHLHPLFS